MSKGRNAIFAVAIALCASSALGDDVPTNPIGDTDANDAAKPKAVQPRALPDRAAKQKAVDSAIAAGNEGNKKEKPLVGDFPPYGGKTVEQWRAEKRRRERLEKMTPQEQDEQSGERKRQRERWENTTPKSPTK